MNIKDILSVHSELNPKLWYTNNLRREVRYHLLLIAKEFIKFINLPDLKLQDVTLSGSNASYNYNSKSDIDLHLVVDERDPCYDSLKELFLAKKSLFNDQHDITVRGINVEVYVQEMSQPHISNGIFSVINDEWIKMPTPIVAEPDLTNVKHKFEFMQHEIEQAVDSNDIIKIAAVKDYVKNMRRAGLAANGEYGAENLAFKMLRNKGLLDKLSDSFTVAQDRRLSL